MKDNFISTKYDFMNVAADTYCIDAAFVKYLMKRYKFKGKQKKYLLMRADGFVKLEDELEAYKVWNDLFELDVFDDELLNWLVARIVVYQNNAPDARMKKLCSRLLQHYAVGDIGSFKRLFRKKGSLLWY